MRFLAHRRRDEVRLPTSSLADIGFLLTVFFVVTAAIGAPTGIEMVLPPVLDHHPPPPPERSVLRVFVDSGGELLVEGQSTALDELRGLVKRHVLNCVPEYDYGCAPGYSKHPGFAPISLHTSNATSYASYIEVLDEIGMAYREMWNDAAKKRGFASYTAYRGALTSSGDDEIREYLEPYISLAGSAP